MTSAQPGKAVRKTATAPLQAEKPRLVPDPAALEAEVGSVDVAQLGRMVNDQSAVTSESPENQSKRSLDYAATAAAPLGMTNAQPGKAVPQTPGAESPENSAAWKQDPAAQGGNFASGDQTRRSAKDLDDKVGREQATEAALQGTRDKGKGCKGVPSTEYQVPSGNAKPGSLDSATHVALLGTTNEDAQPRAAVPHAAQCEAEAKKEINKKYDVEKIGERGVGSGMNFFSIDREIKLGAEMAKEIDAQVKFFTDERVNEYVNRLAQNLARNSDVKLPMSVRITDSDELNAFALPGGRLYVNVGMIMAAESEAELAGVMAHEIAHVAARHATKNATKRQIWNFASIPLMFVGGPAGMVVHNVVQIAVPMTFLKFSRNAEREADLLGIEYAYAAGYDPAAMVNFFEKLQTKDKKKPNFVVRAFQSHPMTDDRLKRAQATIAEMLPAKDEYMVSTSEFDEVKARLTSLTANKLRIGPKDEPKPKLKTAGKWQ
jgi:Zn-dependent protease with chaperone function